jgi:regulatory protein YycH of two-component signal transduction system YycFG
MAVSTLSAQPKSPLIEFQNTKSDQGTVIQGDIIKQAFDFVNKGSGILEILDVEHS